MVATLDNFANFVPVSVYGRDEHGLPTGDVARFVIPQHTYQARLAQEVGRTTGARSVVSRQIHQVSATNQLDEGDTFIWQNDERDARGGKPLAMFRSGTATKMPLLIVGGGVYDYRDLQVQADEAQHYPAHELPYWERVMPDSQVRHDFNSWIERGLHFRHNRRVFAFSKQDYLAPERNFWNETRPWLRMRDRLAEAS